MLQIYGGVQINKLHFTKYKAKQQNKKEKCRFSLYFETFAKMFLQDNLNHIIHLFKSFIKCVTLPENFNEIPLFLELFLLPLMSNPWLISKLTKLSLTVAENVYKNFDDPQSPLKTLQYLR